MRGVGSRRPQKSRNPPGEKRHLGHPTLQGIASGPPAAHNHQHISGRATRRVISPGKREQRSQRLRLRFFHPRARSQNTQGVTLPVMQGQELSPRLRKSDFSTIGLVPDVPDKPIRGVRGQETALGCRPEACSRRRACYSMKTGCLPEIGIHGDDSVCSGLLHFHRVVGPLAIFRPANV